MAIQAQLADGRVLEFPDGTDPSVIQATVKRMVSGGTERTIGEAAADIPAAALSGLGSLLQFPGQLVKLVPGLAPVGEALEKPGEFVSEAGEKLKSEGLKAREALRSKALSEAEKDGILAQFATAITSTISDPALITSFLVEQVPLLLGPGSAAKITQMVGAKSIQAAGVGLSGEAAKEAVKEAAKKVSTRAYGAAYGTGAAMQAADVSSDAYDEAFRKAKEMGMSDDQAQSLAADAGRVAGIGAGSVSLLAQRLPGAKAIEQRLAKVPGTSGKVGAAFGEALAEGVEEGGGQVFKNLGLRQVDPNQPLLEGVGGAAGLGVLGGGVLGGVLGKKGEEERFEGQREGETDRQYAARLQREIAAGLRPAEPAPAPSKIPTDQQLFTLAAQPNGYGLLENMKQRLNADQSISEEDKQAAVNNINSIQERMTVEEIGRQRSSTMVTEKDLLDLGFTPAEAQQEGGIVQTLRGKDLGDEAQSAQVFDALNVELAKPDLTAGQRSKLETTYIDLANFRQNLFPEGQDAGVPKMFEPPKAEAPKILSSTELFDMASKNDYGGIEQYKQGLKVGPQSEEVRKAIADAEFVQRRMNIEAAQRREVKGAPPEEAPEAVEALVSAETKAAPAEKVTKIEGPKPKAMPARAKELPQPPAPKTEEEKQEAAERKAVEKDIRTAEMESRKAARESPSLWGRLIGQLDPKEVFDISPDRRLSPLNKKGGGGFFLDYFVDSGLLDEFLPPNMRHNAAQFDPTDSQEYIKDLIRRGEPSGYITWDAKQKIAENDISIEQMEKLLRSLNTQEINAQLQEIYDERRGEEVAPREVPAPAPAGEGAVAEKRTGEPEAGGKPAAKKSLAEVAKGVPTGKFEELERKAKEAKPEEKAPEAKAEEKPALAPEIQAKIAILEKVLRKNLAKFGLKDVDLNLEEGMADEGSFSGQLIRIALDSPDPLGILRHESIHALKEAGFFTDKQWATLERMADEKWIDQYLKGQQVEYEGQRMSRYDAYMKEYGGNMALIREEAIADAFRAFSKKKPAGLMGALTERMKNFFKAVKSAFNGQGFDSAEDIFGKVEEGKLEAAPAKAVAEEERKSLRQPMATWTDKRIDRLINEYGYTDGRTKAYAASINPADFVLSTTGSNRSAERIYEEAGKLDLEELSSETQTPFLFIETSGKDWQIVGHEGRHRMAALNLEGVTNVPVVLVMYENGSRKPAMYEPKPGIEIDGQDFGVDVGFGEALYARNLVPLSYKYEKQLKEKHSSGDIRFSLRSIPTISQADEARLNETIRPRHRPGFIERMVDAISGKTFSYFREQIINEYNEVAELDKRVAAQIRAMGGAEQMADQRAETACLFSSQAAAVASSAMGTHTRKGGIPVYRNGIVTVDRSGDNEGLVEIFAPLATTGDPRTFQDYHFWAAVNRAKKYILNPGQTRYVEQLFEKSDIDLANQLERDYAAMGINFKDIRSRWIKYNNGLVKLMRDTGAISERAAREFMDHGDYFPFYRQINEEDMTGPKTFSTIAGTKPPKAAKGSEEALGDFFETVIRNTQAAISISMKNVAAQRVTAQALRIDEVVRLSENPQVAQANATTWDVFDSQYADTISAPDQASALSVARNRYGANATVDASPSRAGQWNIFKPVKIGEVPATNAQDARAEAISSYKYRPDASVYKVLENGQPVYYRAYDIKLINALKALNTTDLPFLGLLSAPANLLRTLVTKDPGYMLVNQMRDSLSAWVTSGVKLTPIADSARQFARSMAKETPEMEAIIDGGVIGGYQYTHGTKEGGVHLEKQLRKKAGVKTIADVATSPFTSLWAALEKGTEISDGATRAEVYKRVLAETGNEAEALWQAAEVLNFYRHGRSPVIRVLTAIVPFLNSRIQGLDVLYRAGMNPMLDKNATDAQKQRMKTFWVRGMTLMALSSMYWALTHDDDEYKKQEQETRDNFWLIPSLGIKIAIPFEVGVIFKVLPERILANLFGQDTGKETMESLKRQLQSTFMFTLIPQALLPYYEVATNFSFYTQRPILGKGMEGVAPRFQVSPGTSSLAQVIADKLRVETTADSSSFTKALAKQLEVSPIALDHLIKGYTGTLGQYAVEVFDAIYNLNNDVPKPSKRFEQLPIIKRLALDPDARGNVTAFYDLKNSVDEVVRTSNLLTRSMNFKEWGPYMSANFKMLATQDYVNDLEKSMAEYRDMKRMVQASGMSPDSKRDTIRSIEKMENSLARNIQTFRKAVQG